MIEPLIRAHLACEDLDERVARINAHGGRSCDRAAVDRRLLGGHVRVCVAAGMGGGAMSTYYKATCPDGTDFRTGTIAYDVAGNQCVKDVTFYDDEDRQLYRYTWAAGLCG